MSFSVGACSPLKAYYCANTLPTMTISNVMAAKKILPAQFVWESGPYFAAYFEDIFDDDSFVLQKRIVHMSYGNSSGLQSTLLDKNQRIEDLPIYYRQNIDLVRSYYMVEKSDCALPIFQPHIVCKAEEMFNVLDLGDFVGVTKHSENLEDDGRPLFLFMYDRGDIKEARKKWPNRTIVYYRKKIWTNRKVEGCIATIIDFLLLSMCSRIDTTTLTGMLAKELSDAS